MDDLNLSLTYVLSEMEHTLNLLFNALCAKNTMPRCVLHGSQSSKSHVMCKINEEECNQLKSASRLKQVPTGRISSVQFDP